MLSGVVWWQRGEAIFVTHPDVRPERARFLGVSVLDDAGLIRAWEVMLAQDGASTLVPREAAQEWIDGLPFAG